MNQLLTWVTMLSLLLKSAQPGWQPPISFDTLPTGMVLPLEGSVLYDSARCLVEQIHLCTTVTTVATVANKKVPDQE